MAVALPSDILQTNVETTIYTRDDLLHLATRLAIIEVKCMETCRGFRAEQKELILSKLGYTTQKDFKRDREIYKTVRTQFIETLKRTTTKNGKICYKQSYAEKQWYVFMQQIYGVEPSINSKFALEELPDDERYEIMKNLQSYMA